MVLMDRGNFRPSAIEAGANRLKQAQKVLSGGLGQRPPPLMQQLPPPLPNQALPPPPIGSNAYPQPSAPGYMNFGRSPMAYNPPPTFSAYPGAGSAPPGFFAPPPRNMSRRSSRSSRHRRRSSKRYDSDSDSDTSVDSMDSKMDRILKRHLKENTPDAVTQLIKNDVINAMKHMHSKGYRLPKGYDPDKHNIDDNEIHLYEQQEFRERKRKQMHVTMMLSFAANGLSWFCRAMKFDFIKLTKLPGLIKTAIKDDEFEEFTEGVSLALRGTVFDHPICGAAMKFLEKVGEAQSEELTEENEHLEKRQEERMNKGKAMREHFFTKPRTRKQAGTSAIPAPKAPAADAGKQLLKDLAPPLRQPSSATSSAASTTDGSTTDDATSTTSVSTAPDPQKKRRWDGV